MIAPARLCEEALRPLAEASSVAIWGRAVTFRLLLSLFVVKGFGFCRSGWGPFRAIAPWVRGVGIQGLGSCSLGAWYLGFGTCYENVILSHHDAFLTRHREAKNPSYSFSMAPAASGHGRLFRSLVLRICFGFRYSCFVLTLNRFVPSRID